MKRRPLTIRRRRVQRRPALARALRAAHALMDDVAKRTRRTP